MHVPNEPNLQYNTLVNTAGNVPNNKLQTIMFKVEGDSFKASFESGKQDFIYVSSKNPPQYNGEGTAPKRGLKFHISVDPTRIDEAWKIILDVMTEHNIPKSKFANPNYPGQPGEGREITIYAFKDYARQINKNDDQTLTSWEEIISQITTRLAEANIQPGHAATGNSGGGGNEQTIEGTNYVTWRNDNEELYNIFELHVRPRNPYSQEQLFEMSEKYFTEKNAMMNMQIICPIEQQDRMSLEEFQSRQLFMRKNFSVTNENNTNIPPIINSTSESETNSKGWKSFKYEKKSEKSNFNFSRSKFNKTEMTPPKSEKWINPDYKNKSTSEENEESTSKISFLSHTRKRKDNTNNQTETVSQDNSDQHSDQPISTDLQSTHTTSSITNITMQLGGTNRSKVIFNQSVDIDEDTPIPQSNSEQPHDTNFSQIESTEDKNLQEKQFTEENTQKDKEDKNNPTGGSSFGFGKSNNK